MAQLQLGVNVFPPMFVSSRLMAAVTINGVGTLHLEETGRTDDNRPAYRLVIEDTDGTELLHDVSLESWVGATVDYLGMAQTALSFLTGAAEDWAPRRYAGRLDGEEPLWPTSVIEWADRHTDQLNATAERLERWSDYAAQPDVREFFEAYVECALWSSTDPDRDDEPLLNRHLPSDLAPEAADEMLADCLDFLQDTDNALALAAGGDLRPYSIGQAGHDFWLTRNGHGAGFWDRGLGEVGDQLTLAAKVYGSSDLYVGDDGKLYVT